MLSKDLPQIVEYRGVEGLVAAEVLTDDNGTDGYTTGEVFAVAGVAEITKAVESASETHYYDNMAAIVIDSVGADTISINASAIPIEVQAKLTGQKFLSAKGALVEGGGPTAPYMALGYITSKSTGEKMLVWRFKGKFALGDLTHTTKDNSASANGQSLTYTGIDTTHKWAANDNKGSKGIVVDTSLGLADVSTFFDAVTTPDTLAAVTP